MVAGRLNIRYRVRHCFYWDDFFTVLALVGIYIWSGGCSAIYNPADELFAYERHETPKPSNFEPLFIYFRKIQTFVTIGFWIALFSIKFAFLFFYRLLFSVSRNFNRAWWAVTILTAIVFWACIAGELTKCGPTSQIFSPGAYLSLYCLTHYLTVDLEACSSPTWTEYQRQVEEYGCGIQVGTDLISTSLTVSTNCSY